MNRCVIHNLEYSSNPDYNGNIGGCSECNREWKFKYQNKEEWKKTMIKQWIGELTLGK